MLKIFLKTGGFFQMCIGVALHNGDVLRLDLEQRLQEHVQIMTSGGAW